MPTIPISQGPQVQSRALPTPMQGNIDVSSGLQAVARGIGQAGDVLDRALERDAEAEANRIDTQVTAGWLEWDVKARQQYQGQNVSEYQTKADEWWAKARTEHGGADPRVRARLGEALGRKRNAAMASVLGHVATEKERFADGQAEAAAQTTIEFGIDNNDPASAAARVRSIAAEKGARKGWSTEQTQAEQQRLLGTLHLAYITRRADTDAAGAQAYYEANKTEIPGSAQVKVEQVLRGEADNQFAMQFAAERASKPLSEQLQDASTIKDQQRREKTLLAIHNNHGMVQAAQQQREKAASDQAWQLVGKNQRVPETILMQMNGRERVQLQDHLTDRARLAAERAVAKTDWPTYIAAREALVSDDPKVRASVNLTALSTKVAPAQMEQLLDIKTRTGTGPGPKQDSMMTDHERVTGALVIAGVDPKRHPEDAGMLMSEIDRRVRAESASTGGKEVLATRKQEIIDGVLMDKVYVDEWGTDPQKPLALLKPGELQGAYVKVGGRNVPVASVPSTDRQQIIKALRATRQPVTEQAIVSMYVRGQKKPAASGTVTTE